MRKMVLSLAVFSALTMYGQSNADREMDRFIDELMGRMTLEDTVVGWVRPAFRIWRDYAVCKRSL